MSNHFMMTEEEYRQRYGKTVDLTVDGECSGCGGCCSNRIPLTDKEFQELKRLVRKRKLKPVNRIPVIMIQPVRDMTCPFLDLNGRCLIYKDRPKICRIYRCNKDETAIMKELLNDPSVHQFQIRMLREELF